MTRVHTASQPQSTVYSQGLPSGVGGGDTFAASAAQSAAPRGDKRPTATPRAAHGVLSSLGGAAVGGAFGALNVPMAVRAGVKMRADAIVQHGDSEAVATLKGLAWGTGAFALYGVTAHVPSAIYGARLGWKRVRNGEPVLGESFQRLREKKMYAV